MGRKDQRAEEEAIMAHISSIFPTFLDGIPFVAASSDPPDFFGECEGNRKIGLELTSWLNGAQVSKARGREHMREDLLSVVEWERHPRPRNFSHVVIIPRWNGRISGLISQRVVHGTVGRMIERRHPKIAFVVVVGATTLLATCLHGIEAGISIEST